MERSGAEPLAPAAAFPGAVLSLPFGAFGLREVAGEVVELCFLPPDTPPAAPTSAEARAVADWIDAYLADPHQPPPMPLPAHGGTPFRQRVWQAIAAIPCGEVRRYGDLAVHLASAPRAVGRACGDNPFPLMIPCHRVVGATGLGGFAHARDGHLLQAKRWLLAHEGVL